MKAKYLIIYLAAGAAFLAASLWVFLSKGKNARALRAKYKMGGILLTTWAMLSAASCEGPFLVTCYEPAVTCYDVEMLVEKDVLSVTVKDHGGSRMKPGDVLVIEIAQCSFSDYRVRITADTPAATLIQTESFAVGEGDPAKVTFEMPLASTGYKGAATVTVVGVRKDGDGNETEPEVGKASVTIV